jgi:hypothetical protein
MKWQTIRKSRTQSYRAFPKGVAASFQDNVLFSFYTRSRDFEHFTDKGKLFERVGRKAIGPSRKDGSQFPKRLFFLLLRTISQEY